MKKILFVCHGNICRSPMAEFVLKDVLKKQGGEAQVASAATSREEVGNPVYPPAQAILRQHGIDPEGKKARQITSEDYDAYDLLLGMDEANIQNMLRLFSGDPDNKVRLLMDLAGEPRDIADPWYTGDFQQTWEDVNRGCGALLEQWETL